MCAEGIFVTFPWWLQNVKSRSKIALFQMSAILKFEKDSILHVTSTFSLK